MTDAEIRALPACPKLDALVAELVMGLRPGVDFGDLGEHEWQKNEDGEVDDFGMDCGNHNGPACVKCDYSYCQHCQAGPDEGCEISPRRYSGDIAAAWQVVEKIKDLTPRGTWGMDNDHLGDPCDSFAIDWIDWRDTLRPTGKLWWAGWYIYAGGERIGSIEAHGETMPLAVCRAAILAVSQKAKD